MEWIDEILDDSPKPELIGVWFESMIEGMIECASIDERLRHSLTIELRDGLTWQRANEIKRFLEDYQPDPITQVLYFLISYAKFFVIIIKGIL